MSRIAEPSPQGQEGPQQSSRPTRGKLVQRLLDASASLPAFLNDLLTTQAVLVAGTEAAAFLIERQGDQAALRNVAHIRPDDSDTNTRTAAIQAFQGIVAPCVEQGKDGAIEVGSPDGGDAQYCLVTVLRNEGQVVGASAVITRARDGDRARQRLTSMQLVAGYFELFSMRRYVEQTRVAAERHQQVLQYAGAVATAEGFEAAAGNLCNEIATRAGASRVSIGWVKGNKTIKVRALSHTEKFDKKQELVVLIQRVMEECYDQEEPVRFDPSGKCSANVTRASGELSRTTGGNVVLSMPLRQRDEIVGIMTVEWPPGPVDEQDEAGVGVAAELLAPQLADRFHNDRYIFTKMGLSIGGLAKAAVGPRHTGVKLLIALGIALVLFVALFKMEYRVQSSVVLAPLHQRSLCAPFDGQIEQVFVRPGQRVSAGDRIATLKTTEMQVRLAEMEAEARSRTFQADRARKEGKIAEQKAAEADRDKFLAQAKLLKYYIEQATIVSPINGVLVTGDLYDRQGAPVRQGEVLFEIAQSDKDDPSRIAVEAEVKVSERDIQLVRQKWMEREQVAAQGQARVHDGEISTTSFPNLGHKFTITRVVPMGTAKDGENVFSVYGTIEAPEPWMHPGLAGEARINIEKRPLWWIWTHRLTDWLKLKLWI